MLLDYYSLVWKPATTLRRPLRRKVLGSKIVRAELLDSEFGMNVPILQLRSDNKVVETYPISSAPDVYPTSSGTSSPAVNIAAASNGGTASASSYYTAAGSYLPQYAINGEVNGNVWGTDGGWNSVGDPQSSPEWLEVTFVAAQTINQIDVYTIQDDYPSPVTPVLNVTTNSLYGIKDFLVQYRNGAGPYVTVATVTNNNLVWTRYSFAPVTATSVRLYVTKSQDSGAGTGYARVVELEARTVPTAAFTYRPLVRIGTVIKPLPVGEALRASPLPKQLFLNGKTLYLDGKPLSLG